MPIRHESVRQTPAVVVGRHDEKDLVFFEEPIKAFGTGIVAFRQ